MVTIEKRRERVQVRRVWALADNLPPKQASHEKEMKRTQEASIFLSNSLCPNCCFSGRHFII